MTDPAVLTVLSGALVGLVLSLVGGGGSILAVPLMVYGVGITSTHVAIGTSAVAVAASAAFSLLTHWRAGHVKWRCAMVFSVAGMAGAWSGAGIAKLIDGQTLLAAFGGLMLVVGLTMLLKRGTPGDPDVRLDRHNMFKLAPKLLVIGFLVGGLSGFFGIGGGFLIVPGLMLATGMPLVFAIGTSLVAITVFGTTAASSYALSGLVDWRIAGLFVSGGAAGGLIGAALGRLLAGRTGLLRIAFALVVITAGTFIAYDGLRALSG